MKGNQDDFFVTLDILNDTSVEMRLSSKPANPKKMGMTLQVGADVTLRTT